MTPENIDGESDLTTRRVPQLLSIEHLDRTIRVGKRKMRHKITLPPSPHSAGRTMHFILTPEDRHRSTPSIDVGSPPSDMRSGKLDSADWT